MGEEDCKVFGAYGRDTRVSNSNRTSLLRFMGDNKLALVNTFFYVPKGCTSRTFNATRPADRNHIDYIITRQSHRKLVQNVTVHLQPHADSDYNIVCARVRFPGRFARNRKQQNPQGTRVLTDELSRLTPTDANGWFNLLPVSSCRPNSGDSGAQSAKKRPFSPTHSYGSQGR